MIHFKLNLKHISKVYTFHIKFVLLKIPVNFEFLLIFFSNLDLESCQIVANLRIQMELILVYNFTIMIFLEAFGQFCM